MNKLIFSIYGNLKKETSCDYILEKDTRDISELTDVIFNLFYSKSELLTCFCKENNLSIKIFISIIVKKYLSSSLFFEQFFLNFINNIEAEIDIEMEANG